MDKSLKKNRQEQEKKPFSSNRRGFLKKATYIAPTLVALGTLTKPTESKAGFGPPPSAPDWP